MKNTNNNNHDNNHDSNNDNNDDSDDLRKRVLDAYSAYTPLRIVGGDTKHFYADGLIGKALYINKHIGIISYEPSELVITVRSGTCLSFVEKTLAEHNQMLPFEPPAYEKGGTIGGAIASGLSGPRRPFTGSVRDYVLGCKVLSGDGKILAFGGQVMKNVAGYDVSRLMVGAMGTLGVLLEISIKVLPKPEKEISVYMALSPQEAIDVMNARMAKSLPLSAACYDGETMCLRLSGSESGLKGIKRKIAGDLLDNGEEFWRELNDQQHFFFKEEKPLWRLSLASGTLHLGLPGQWFFDWGGALRWLKTFEPVDNIRAAVVAEGGHATLFRGKYMFENIESIEVFHPLPNALARITVSIKKIFDPRNILNKNRIYRQNLD